MKAVQVPAIFVALMRLMPSWKQMKAVAPTLVHDVSLVEPYWRGRPLPKDRWSSVKVPTLIIDGGKSPAWMRNAQRALAAAVPHAATLYASGTDAHGERQSPRAGARGLLRRDQRVSLAGGASAR